MAGYGVFTIFVASTPSGRTLSTAITVWLEIQERPFRTSCFRGAIKVSTLPFAGERRML